MLHRKLTHPKSIVVIGASNNVHTPGGLALKNVLSHNFEGTVIAVNPKEDEIQGVRCYRNVHDIPEVDLAIIAIAAKYTLDTIQVLTTEKNTRGFILFSAGFSEKDEEGQQLEDQIVKCINNVNGSLLGPNNIGLINQQYAGVFTTPVPKLCASGVDFISGSGATAVFTIEAAMEKGLPFASVWSVGNSAQTGVEDVIEHLDLTFDPAKSATVKLLYLESIENPKKLLKHAQSLISKGCRIAAIKAGSSLAGSRAASSHTGAMATSDMAVDALFQKAGIIRCYGRDELINVASVLWYNELKGTNIAIITHAGGPAVMLTDILTQNGLQVPEITSKAADALLENLYPGSSVKNPIDFLATGDAEQLGLIIDYCEHDFDEIDAMVVIFGSPGLFRVHDVYAVLDQKMRSCKKPIFPILPSVHNVKEEIAEFIDYGHVNFPDEVSFGNALSKIYGTDSKVYESTFSANPDHNAIRAIVDNSDEGYLLPEQVNELLQKAGIPVVQEFVCKTLEEGLIAAATLEYPVVMKVVGVVHKTDVDGIRLGIDSEAELQKAFVDLMHINGATGVLIQPMVAGIELFAGVKFEEHFGHLIMCGLGGVYVEVLKDVSIRLAPLSINEAMTMIHSLKSFKILEGVRNRDGINVEKFAELLVKLSALISVAPEIVELDLNPVMGTPSQTCAVDARIRIRKCN